MAWELLAPLIAAAITLAAMRVATRLTNALRRHDYKLFEDKSAKEIERQFPLPEGTPSPADARLRSLSGLLDKVHQTANATQTRYHNAVTQSAGCLAVAALALALGTLPLGAYLELMLSWLEVIALVGVLILFPHGRSRRWPWIKARVGTELLRQYQMLRMVFPAALSPTPAGDPSADFDREAARIDAEVQSDPNEARARPGLAAIVRGLIEQVRAVRRRRAPPVRYDQGVVVRIEQYWARRRADLAQAALTEADVTADAVLVYLRRRARRQLGWFIDSRDRLRHIGERRSVLLVALYCAAVLIAAARLGLFLVGRHAPDYLLAPLLIATGLSAAMTAYYVNQNARSLIHRYNTQQRRAARWLTEFNDRWRFDSLPNLNMDLATRRDMRDRILLFEDLMIEELTDWIHITSHDAIELGAT